MISIVELVVTIRARVTFLADHVYILLDHLVYLDTQLLVDFSLDNLRVDEQSHQKSQSHQSQDYQDRLPHTFALVPSINLVVLLDELYALRRRVYQRVADSLKHLWSLEQAIKVAVIYRCLWVEIDP